MLKGSRVVEAGLLGTHGKQNQQGLEHEHAYCRFSFKKSYT